MRKTIFNHVNEPYSLHDMNIISFDADGDTLTVRTQSGLIKTANPCTQVDAYVEIHDVDWDFCYAYVYEGFYGNVGSFSGKKIFLRDFIKEFENAGFSVMDTHYGFNSVAYTGYYFKGGTTGECRLEIYYLGELVFCEQLDEDKREMKEVILSADGDLRLYLVPADVADNLDRVCKDFASNYVWHGPNAKFLRLCGKQYVAFYTVEDFIDYLNEVLYPQFCSREVERLGSFDEGIPEQYRNIPRYNF